MYGPFFVVKNVLRSMLQEQFIVGTVVMFYSQMQGCLTFVVAFVGIASLFKENLLERKRDEVVEEVISRTFVLLMNTTAVFQIELQEICLCFVEKS
jgi:hypothetical protein